MQSMKILVVGCGSIGERHIGNLRELSVNNIIACDTAPERIALMKEKYGVEEIYTDYRDAMQGEFDAVLVCTPPSTHIPIGLHAADCNAHLFIEKPFSNNLDEVDTLLEAASKKKLVLCVGYNLRFHRGVKLAREILDRGDIGRVLFARVEFGQYLPDWRAMQDYRQSYTVKEELGGGVLLDVSHEIDYMRWFFGKIEKIFCFTGRISSLEMETEDIAEILLKFRKNITAEIHLDFIRRDYSRTCEIIGEKGTIKWNYQDNLLKVYSADTKEWKNFNIEVDTNDMYLEQTRHFLSCIKEQKKPLVDGKEGKKTLEIILSAKKSAQQQRMIDLRRIVAIIQARMGSSRLPGKVMMDISGKPMLWHVINRLKHVKRVDEIVVATTVRDEDKPVLKIAEEAGIRSYAGSEDDVLDRYYQAAKFYNADVIVRITADCPLVDPQVIDKSIELYLSHDFNYAGTAIGESYPDGVDTEIFDFAILKRAWEEAVLASEREHVTTYIWKRPEMFTIKKLKNERDLSHLRWTVDEKCDLELVREIYRALYRENEMFYMQDVLDLLEKMPQLMEINKSVVKNAGYLKSLREDRVVRQPIS